MTYVEWLEKEHPAHGVYDHESQDEYDAWKRELEIAFNAGRDTRTPTPAVDGDETHTNPVVSQNAPDLKHTPAPQGAPETKIEYSNDEIRATHKLITWAAGLIKQFPEHGGCDAWMQHYTYGAVMKDYASEALSTSDARIAELEAEVAILADGAFEAAKAPKHDNRVLAVLARERDINEADVIATARNEALEEAVTLSRAGWAGADMVLKLRALKTEQGEG